MQMVETLVLQVRKLPATCTQRVCVFAAHDVGGVACAYAGGELRRTADGTVDAVECQHGAEFGAWAAA